MLLERTTHKLKMHTVKSDNHQLWRFIDTLLMYYKEKIFGRKGFITKERKKCHWNSNSNMKHNLHEISHFTPVSCENML